MRLLRTTMLSLAGAVLLSIPGLIPANAQTTADVTVTATTVLGTIPPMAYGVNTAVWDGVLTDPDVPALLSAVGTGALRYPGGSTSDDYHWQTNSDTGQTWSWSSANDFDGFMTSVAQPTGASPIITVNYGSNPAGTGGADPSEAAAWVNYSNNVQHYGVKYWEIGNEMYGNGEYDGVQWETDLHASHSPTAYGENVLKFVTAMKAEDPTIKVGAVLALPGYWPEGIAPDWDDNVLKECGKHIDFVILHWYPQNPGGESDSFLLSAPSQIAAIIAGARADIKKYCGTNAPNVQILITETNSVSSDPGRQVVSLVNALFVADNYMTWLENGVSTVDLWALHNGATAGNYSSSLYGTTFYGDYGMLADGGLPELGDESPFPDYYAKQMLTYVGLPGDEMVKSKTNNSLLAAHAVLQSNGNLALLMINKDPLNRCTATVNVNGYTPGDLSTTYFYGEPSASVSQAAHKTGATYSIALPPYSLTTIVMAPTAISTPAFTSSATTVVPFTVAGTDVGVSATATNTGAAYSGAVMNLELVSSGGMVVYQKSKSGLSFANKASHSITATWAAPSTPGAYSVVVQVYSAGKAQLLYSSGDTNLTVNPADTAEYNFEAGIPGWTSSGGMISGVETSGSQAFAGLGSLEVNFTGAAADTQSVAVSSPAAVAGDTVTFEVWVPADTTLAWVQPFALDFDGNWIGDWQPLSNLQGNAWNTFTMPIPLIAVMPLSTLGVQFNTTGAWTGNCYVDSVGW
jgi:hypothetical protein